MEGGLVTVGIRSKHGRRVAVPFRSPEKAEPYAEALRAAGVEPVLVLPEQGGSADEYDGLLLTGGTDIAPALYGQAPLPETGKPDPERDRFEFRLLTAALELDRPVLAICRGFQLMNVAHGGTLDQHIGEQHRVKGREDVHAIEVIPGSRLAAILGPGSHLVNSRHHQAVERLGKGLVVSAISQPDGVIEGLEQPHRRFAIAVQWHPEDRHRTNEKDCKLFAAFAAAL